jgi:hypothetical protein
VTVDSWEVTAGRMVDRLGVGLDALWAVLFAAQTAALGLSLAGPLVDEQRLSAVALDLAEAVEELEWARPGLTGRNSTAVPTPRGGYPRNWSEAMARSGTANLLWGLPYCPWS